MSVALLATDGTQALEYAVCITHQSLIRYFRVTTLEEGAYCFLANRPFGT
jgi:hypothetical protein